MIWKHAAWRAWRAGDFAGAKFQADALLAEKRRVDEANHVAALVALVTGDSGAALDAYAKVNPRYRRFAELDLPMLWAHLLRDDLDRARAHAERRGLLADQAIRERFRLASEQPLRCELASVVELPFADDALTPWMPGVRANVNGKPAVARLDTGGAFLCVSPSLARTFGVQCVAYDVGFASLVHGRIGYGVADLDLGPVRLRGVPVHVIDALEGVAVSGVALGPVIGTSLLRRFLSTIDTPGGRLVLSPRHDETARASHLQMLDGHGHEVPFAMWPDHFLIARGAIGPRRDLNFFVDSGLVAMTPERGQAALLGQKRVLAGAGADLRRADPLVEVPGAIALGGARREGLSAFPVDRRTWRNFDDMGGIRIDALLSQGFLKHFSWTIDFDRHRFLLAPGPRS